MKKFLVIALTLILVTGCGVSKEEKEKMLYNSLEKAYVAVYSAEGVGLAVYPNEKKEIDGKSYYLVAINKYNNIEKLMSFSKEVYDDKIADSLNEKIKAKYWQDGEDLYTLSNGGCNLDYVISGDSNNSENGDKKATLQDDIKQDIKIKKIKSSKIIFEYKGEEYTATMEDDHYVFDKQIFTCPKED